MITVVVREEILEEAVEEMSVEAQLEILEAEETLEEAAAEVSNMASVKR